MNHTVKLILIAAGAAVLVLLAFAFNPNNAKADQCYSAPEFLDILQTNTDKQATQMGVGRLVFVYQKEITEPGELTKAMDNISSWVGATPKYELGAIRIVGNDEYPLVQLVFFDAAGCTRGAQLMPREQALKMVYSVNPKGSV
jgi:hypothetical protein